MILDCPRCGVKHVQTTQQFRQSDNPNLPAGDQWNVERCQNPACNSLVLAITAHGGTLVRTWPARQYELDEALKVEQALRDDYREAGLCLDAACFKASLVMSRRALQRVLKAQGCKQRNLGGERGALAYAVSKGILRKTFHALAEEIKEYGNLGAHPDDDQLENASKESAEHVLRFLELIIDEFYRVPMAAENLRRKRVGST